MPRVEKQTMRPVAVRLATAKKVYTAAKREHSESASAWDLAGGVKINLYGRSGTGKTTLWATFPKPILAIICSGGRVPGELKSIDTPEHRKTIDPRVIRRSSDVPGLLERMGGYETVVLDHASGLQDMVLKEILGLEKIPEQLSWGLASQQQYGQLALQMKELLRALLSLPQHVVIVAQEREFNAEAGGELLAPYVASALTPSVVGWLNPACDYICQTFVRQRTEEKQVKIGGAVKRVRQAVKGKVDYCLRTAPDPVYMSKFRLPRGRGLPDVIVDPTYDKLDRLIRGKGD